MEIKAKHWAGLSLAGGGSALGVLATALGWFTKNVTVNGNQICAAGLPTSVTGIVAGLLTIGGVIAGALVLLVAPSIKPAVNLAAVDSAKSSPPPGAA